LALLVLAGLWLAGCGAESPKPPQEAQVTRVIDGGTLILEGGARVRLLGIDAPRMGKEGQPPEFMALQAKTCLADMALGKKVRLEYDQLRYDPFGSLLAYLFLPGGTFINGEIVRQGLARVYLHDPNFRYGEILLAAQKEAMAAARGLWQKQPQAQETDYVGNSQSRRVHRPDCPLAAGMARAHRVRFTSLQEAYEQGYTPCRYCQP
jgi:micrococcal nuclease